MRGEVTLNGITYKTKGLPTQTLANQMASKVGQGQSNYADLTNWSAWIQEDWVEGIGKNKPHQNGGFLYAEMESRVPGQLILPPRITVTDYRDINGTSADCRFVTDGEVGVVGVGGELGDVLKLAMKFTTPAGILSPDYIQGWWYASAQEPTLCRLEIWTDDGGPDAAMAGAAFTIGVRDTNYGWHGTELEPVSEFVGDFLPNTDYWLAISPVDPTQTINVVIQHTGYDSIAKRYDGDAWYTLGDVYSMFAVKMFPLNIPSEGKPTFVRFNNQLYLLTGNGIWRYNVANDNWVFVAFTASSVASAVSFAGLLYIGQTASAYQVMNAAETLASGGAYYPIFAKTQDGYLWRANQTTVENSRDGLVWEPTTSFDEPVLICDTSDKIQAMCVLNGNMFVATNLGLVCVFPGDIGRPVVQWGAEHEGSMLSMVQHQGALYVNVNGRVLRYTDDGAVQDIWLTQEDSAITERLGKVLSLAVTNNWLIAYVEGVGDVDIETEDSPPAVLAYQNNSWHFMANTFPPHNFTKSMHGTYSSNRELNLPIFYDRPTQSIWILDAEGLTYKFYVPDYTINPYNDDSYAYEYSGWIEWDWFDGPVLEAPKDYESITIIGENFDVNTTVDAYWKDDNSTIWELLTNGTFASNNEEVRWSIDDGDRPNTLRFKLALRMFTRDDTRTARIRAVRVKYHLMVTDWFRWNMAIDISGRGGAYQMLADGTRNNLTHAELKATLDELSKQVPPFVYEDIDGVQYEVKITDANFSYTLFEINEATGSEYWEGQYNLVLEQVTNSPYLGI